MAELYSFGQHGFEVQYGLWRYSPDVNGVSPFNTNRVLTEDDGASASETGFKWINELSYQKDRQAFTLTAYTHLINNYIFDRPVAVLGTFRGPMPAFIYDQADVLFVGVDFTYSHSFTKSLKGTLGGSYLWSQNISKNEPLINQPPVNINAVLSWKTPRFLGLDASKLVLKASYTFQQWQAPRTVTPEQLISGEEEVTLDSEIF